MKRRRVLISADAEAQLDAIRSWWLAIARPGLRRFSREVREALRSLDVDVQRRPLHPIVLGP